MLYNPYIPDTVPAPPPTVENHRLWVYDHPRFKNQGLIILIPTYFPASTEETDPSSHIHGIVVYRTNKCDPVYELGKDFVWSRHLFEPDEYVEGKINEQPAFRPFYGSVTLVEDKR